MPPESAGLPSVRLFERIIEGPAQRREFHEALLKADPLEDLPGKWQPAILKAEDDRPKLRIVESS